MHLIRIAAAFGLAVAFACASTQVSDREVVDTGRLPRPDHIWVYDFGASPDDVPDASALAGRYDPAQRPSEEELAEGRALGAELARALVSDLQDLGLPATHGSADSRPDVGDVEIRGYLASIHEGSAAERMVVGFGAGASKLSTIVEGFEVTPHGLRKLGSGTVNAGGPKGPGAAVPAAVAVATANPVGLIVTTAIKGAGEVSGRSTIEGRARQTAKEIVKEMEPRLREEGWIQ